MFCLIHALYLLSRCLFEAWMGAYYGDCNKYKVAFPGRGRFVDYVCGQMNAFSVSSSSLFTAENVDIEAMFRFEASCRKLDVAMSEAGKPDDKARILSAVRHSGDAAARSD